MNESDVNTQVGKVRKAGRNVLSQSAPAQVAKGAAGVGKKAKAYVSNAGGKIKAGMAGMFK